MVYFLTHIKQKQKKNKPILSRGNTSCVDDDSRDDDDDDDVSSLKPPKSSQVPHLVSKCVENWNWKIETTTFSILWDP